MTERISLRLLTLEDAEEVYRHFSDHEVTKYMDIEPCKSRKEAEEIIRYHLEDAGCRWGLYDKQNQSFLGTCGFHYLRDTDHSFMAEIGFDLTKHHWGKGLMSEAMQAVIEYGFTIMKLDVIDATVEPANERSIRLMKQLGFQRERELREELIYYYLNRP
ncbi:GNAT family N-acetyltransferase [Paenibacillus spongiae]|uniref:GNAT family N-acetyltransferase n=1 Tax=Paenibacillus spongiae TaxID=2909671 RepID=UPI00283A8FFC|nr:GNAT family N-acetyltransferase [Paenibacillus spongiae]